VRQAVPQPLQRRVVPRAEVVTGHRDMVGRIGAAVVIAVGLLGTEARAGTPAAEARIAVTA
jgi:hypothetical protein